MVEEAAVLAQLRIVARRERPDQPVGQDRPARQVVESKVRSSSSDSGVSNSALPRGVVVEEPAHLLARAQRLGERGEDPLGDAGEHRLPRRIGSSIGG